MCRNLCTRGPRGRPAATPSRSSARRDRRRLSCARPTDRKDDRGACVGDSSTECAALLTIGQAGELLLEAFLLGLFRGAREPVGELEERLLLLFASVEAGLDQVDDHPTRASILALGERAHPAGDR